MGGLGRGKNNGGWRREFYATREKQGHGEEREKNRGEEFSSSLKNVHYVCTRHCNFACDPPPRRARPSDWLTTCRGAKFRIFASAFLPQRQPYARGS